MSEAAIKQVEVLAALVKETEGDKPSLSGAVRQLALSSAVAPGFGDADLDEDAVDDIDGDEEDDAERPGRRRRRNRTRARTISIRRLSKAELNRGRMLYPEEEYWRPKTRTECVDMERPCPFVSCKYHLYIDVHPVRGSIKLNFPDVDVWEMTETCSLDIADRGGITLEEVGEIMNLTRERVRQVETTGLGKLEAVKDIERLKDYVF
ncbi:MAG: DNA-binding protein [Sandaracinaceae bacterium]|jgi:hypothetical protein|nr:DNA-binding protein [Sandaracinaceae bacterium]MBK7155587.1 DNA-binding protein [Sandaracinaceae bacterium]MBK7776987.1 DNA-binding protein [Sandaracinaceae bacterium]MBK8409545.1 DNA-binding protein [Sandaracinaceae bacterium]MBK8592809.1 DNA-binding protein [Sandaracinaceae bacterium]